MKKINLFLLGILSVFGFTLNVKAAALQDLITNAKDGDTVKLDADYTEQIDVQGKSITIDLNGHNLTVTGHAIVVENDAKLTLTGNGNVNSTSAAILNKGGEVTVNGGTYNSSSWYTVKNLGTMTINGGSFTQGTNNKSNASLIDNGWVEGNASKKASSSDVGVAAPSTVKAVMTINGGTFNHYTTTSTIKSDDWSKTVITNGTFVSAQGFLIQATGDVTISGGTFTGYDYISVFNADGSQGYEPGLLNITGGTFSANYIIKPYTIGTLSITGGTFKVTGLTASTKTFTKSITGGTFSFDITSNLPEKYEATLTNGNYVVQQVKKLETTDNTVTFESKEALKNTYVLVVSDATKELEDTKVGVIKSNIDTAIAKLITEDKKEPDTIKLVALYDIKVTDAANVVKMENGDFTITLTIDTTTKYDDYKVVYINDDGDVAETLSATLNGDKITFNTTHLSTYGVVGYNEKETATNTTTEVVENPKTGDNIVVYVILGLASAMSIAFASFYLKKRMN